MIVYDYLMMSAQWQNGCDQCTAIRGNFAGMHFFKQIVDTVLDAGNVLSTACVQFTQDLFEQFTVQLKKKIKIALGIFKS